MDHSIILKTNLFQGINEEESKHLLDCLHSQIYSYKKGQTIFNVGEEVHSLGLILKGSIHVEVNDVWGNLNIIGHFSEGETFNEVYASLEDEKMMIDVVAASDCQILLLDMGCILKTCAMNCLFHHQFIKNLVSVIAKKNLILMNKVQHVTSRTIRGRLLSYLSYEAMKNESHEFGIPFNRQQLADYLCVDRSAMSNELSKMQKEGMIIFNKNHFILKITVRE